jgi:DNA-binding transcriptional MerR regulator
MYRQEDVDMVMKIKRLLYDEGFTIAGARRHLREQNGASFMSADSPASHGGSAPSNGSPSHSGHTENTAELLSRKMLLDLRDSLRAFLTLLERR